MKTTKKQQILTLWKTQEHNIWSIAEAVGTTPSYVAQVLQNEQLISGYHDLYTKSDKPINIYSAGFQGKLGFKDLETAQRSLNLIKEAYLRFDDLRDRAGQHHCLVSALTICNRALSTGKHAESEVFRRWLIERLAEMKSTEMNNQWGHKR